jgi:hypothetical protein
VGFYSSGLAASIRLMGSSIETVGRYVKVLSVTYVAGSRNTSITTRTESSFWIAKFPSLKAISAFGSTKYPPVRTFSLKRARGGKC